MSTYQIATYATYAAYVVAVLFALWAIPKIFKTLSHNKDLEDKIDDLSKPKKWD